MSDTGNVFSDHGSQGNCNCQSTVSHSCTSSSLVMRADWPLKSTLFCGTVENSRQRLDISRPPSASLWVWKNRSAIVHAFCHRVELVFRSSRTGVMSNLGKNKPVARPRVDFLDINKFRCRSTSFPCPCAREDIMIPPRGFCFPKRSRF